MRRPGLFATQFHIPVELPLHLYSFQLATGLVVARLDLITSSMKSVVIPECFYQDSSDFT